MPKYSTGGGGSGGDGGACELCGAATEDLVRASVAGAELQVCADCAPHGEEDAGEADEETEDADRRRQAAQNAAQIADVGSPDPDDPGHWARSGTSYDGDRLPYLVTDYAERVVDARQDAGLQRQELAEELGVDEADLLAVEQGRAAQAGVGGSLVAALEDRLDLDLSED
ncbi:MAG: multiprotein-bridging factor 1 family protein [Halobacteriaceae archaeon]